MSIETGPYAEYVYLTIDGNNGRTKEALIQTGQAMVEEGADRRIWDALGEIILSTGTKHDVVERFKQSGQYLIGMNSYYGWNDKPSKPFDAMLYAQVEGLMENGAFSTVRIGTWIRRSEDEKGAVFMGKTLREHLMDLALTDVSDKDEDDMIWGVPVGRKTVIGDLGQEHNYVFGHEREIEAVDSLPVPDRLKGLLKFITQAWHRSELMQEDGEASFADVQDALADQWF